jgi:hypothetical protein
MILHSGDIIKGMSQVESVSSTVVLCDFVLCNVNKNVC